ASSLISRTSVITHKLPPLTPSTLHLKFLAAPINPSDINQIEGAYPLKPIFRNQLGDVKFDPAVAVGGNEGVAEVIAVGENVKEISVGDWVIMGTSGTWRTHAEATPEDVIRIPREGIELIQAATVRVNSCTAYRMLKDFAKFKKGDYVIQNGANSGVGQAVIQIAKAWGINTINIVRDRPNLRELSDHLKSLGATYVVSDKDLQSKKRSEFEWNTGTDNGDIVLGLNCVGGKSVIHMAKLLKHSSPVVTYGAMSRQPLTIPASQLIFQNLKFYGFWMSHWSQVNPREARLLMLNEVIDLIKQGKLGSAVYEENLWGKDEDHYGFLEILKKAEEEFKGKKQIVKMID
ncbi:9069_t:CDS:2, partial [Acaulospora colombiana]